MNNLNNNRDRTKPIIIIGMHRSGTSVVASIVNDMGVHLGDRLLGATKDNPTGHFEDVSFLRLHENILRGAGGDWDSPPSPARLKKSWSLFRHDVEFLLQSKSGRNNWWGWKEPRTSLFLWLYKDILRECKVIYCRREASSIADSICRRDGIAKSYAKKLAVYYQEQIETALLGAHDFDVLQVEYEVLLSSPRDSVRKIDNFIFGETSEKRVSALAQNILHKPDLDARAGKFGSRLGILAKTFKQPGKAFWVLYWRALRAVWRVRWRMRGPN